MDEKEEQYQKDLAAFEKEYPHLDLTKDADGSYVSTETAEYSSLFVAGARYGRGEPLHQL